MGFVNSVASHLNEGLWDLCVFNVNCSRFVDVEIKFEVPGSNDFRCYSIVIGSSHMSSKEINTVINTPCFTTCKLLEKQRFQLFCFSNGVIIADGLITEIIMNTEIK